MKMKKIIIFLPLALLAVLFAFPKNSRADSTTPIFSESFESLDSIRADGGNPSGVNIVSGKQGNGISLKDAGSFLSFPAANHINFQKAGTIDFWVKPNWNGSDITWNKYFFDAEKNNNIISVYRYQTGANENRLEGMFAPPGEQGYRGAGRADVVKNWKAGEWHNIKIYWDFTLTDKGKQYLAISIDGKYPDITRWWMGGPTFTELPDSFFIGSSAAKDQQADAVIDELKIYDQSLFKLYDPKDPQTEAFWRDLHKDDGTCDNFESYADSPNDCPKISDSIKQGQDILVYKKAPFEAVYPNTTPTDSEISDTLSYQEATNEFEPLFFNIYSRKDFSNVKLSYTDFTGPNGSSIPKSNLDLRIVRDWFQSSDGPVRTVLTPTYVPELLLQNDQVTPERDTWTTWKSFPSLPVLDHAETVLTGNTSKQFVLNAKVSSGTAAGTYSSTLTLTSNNNTQKTFTINLEVLPFELKDSGKIYSTYVPLSFTWTPTLIDGTLYGKMVQNMKDYGFNGVFHYGMAQDTYQYYVDKGFSKLIGWLGGYYDSDSTNNSLHDWLKSHGYEAYFYGADEPSTVSQYQGLVNELIKSHNHDLKLAAAISIGALNRLDNCNDTELYSGLPQDACKNGRLDWANLTLEDPAGAAYVNSLATGTAQRDNSRTETYYWSNMNENPQLHRFLTGYYLWNSGLDGVMPFSYLQGFPSDSKYPFGGPNSNNSYNDFATSNWVDARPAMIVYPSQEGPVPTIQEEAMRAGINDERYMDTWKWYYDQVKATNPTLAAASSDAVNGVLAKYKDYNKLSTISMTQYANDRQMIINEIKKLQGSPSSSSDINQDGSVNLTDFNILKTDFLKLTSGLANPKSDINGDGQVTIKDVGILMSGWK